MFKIKAKILIILSLSVFIILKNSNATTRFEGGAINFNEKIKKVKRDEIISPASIINISATNKHKSSNNSIISNKKDIILTSENNNEISSVAQNRRPQSIYDDFDDIFKEGKYVGHYKIGKSYKVEGIFYHPQEYDDYEEVGVASWYGEQFDGKETANGEIYNLHSMTAAHKTLPLPSFVRVTNMQNRKSVIVRVNDRGPFVKDRIIDLSKKAAEILEYKHKGTTIVKVELLEDETKKLHKKLNIAQN